MRTRSTTFLALFLSGTMAAGVALAADGDPDPTFSGDGKVTTAVAPAADNDFGSAMALQWDGKIVVAGGAENTAGGTFDDIAIARFNPNGTLDKTFSGDGKVTTAVAAGANPDGVSDIVLQPDGKIVVVGYSLTLGGGKSLLARYTSTGKLDKTFSGDGIAMIPSTTAISEATSVALTSKGRIVVAGHVAGGATGDDMAVLRFTSRGALDTTFGGGDGVVALALGSETDQAEGLTIAPDGKIIAVGRRGSASGTFDDFAVVRLLADGTPDGTFGFEGIVTTDIGGSGDLAHAVATQWDGKIVVAGKSLVPDTGNDATVVRYNKDGTLDTTFGEGDGIALTSIAPTSGSDWFEAVVIQWNGKIVGAGQAEDSASNIDFATARLDATTSVRKSTALAPSTLLRRQVPTGASVKITVAKTSRKVCTVSRGKLKTLKTGTCRATVAVSPRQGRTVRVSVSFRVVD